MNKFKVLKERWMAEKPKFWKDVQKICITAGVVGGTLTAAPVTLPVVLITIGHHLAVAGVFGTIISQLTSTQH